MSLSKLSALRLEVETPGRMIIQDLDGKPLRDDDGCGFYIDVYSSDSEIARRHETKWRQKRLDARRRPKVRTGEIDEAHVELLVALTAGAGKVFPNKEGEITPEGRAEPDAEFSTEVARRWYSEPEWAALRDQVDEYAADRGNFSKASSTSSSPGRNKSSGEPAGEAMGPRKATTPKLETES